MTPSKVSRFVENCFIYKLVVAISNEQNKEIKRETVKES